MNPLLNFPVKFGPEAYRYGKRSSGETHGVVLTKPHIVELILDLAGYTIDRDLAAMKLLEPSCGTGAFLIPAVRRLIRSMRGHGRKSSELASCLLAFDIDLGHIEQTKRVVEAALNEEGIDNGTVKSLAARWIRHEDYLLAPIEVGSFDAVVGNPPYIRIEQLAPELQAEYRHRYESLYDRADIYVAFIEKSLEMLAPTGTLSFICADRWTLNRYGAPLRRLISERFRVKSYIDLHQASPFESEVIAYPSIFAITPGRNQGAALARMTTASPEECASLVKQLRNPKRAESTMLSHYPAWFVGEEPWVLSPPEHLKALRELERRFATLEADGRTKVRIGVATGNDASYIVGDYTDIEKDRLVPLVMREDIEAGRLKNSRRFVINTFDAHGRVIMLSDYPRLRHHLEARGLDIKRRHVAKKNPDSWFRTIDRVYPELVKVPKLLIPDIAGSNEVALDKGNYQPHHNLYFVVSETWDMEVLGGLLSSKVALFFIWSYATKMRGSYLRFQAQYLRRIRVPKAADLPVKLTKDIRAAFKARDFKKLDELALEAYGLKRLPTFDFVDTRH